MQARPRSALEVIQAKFFLELLMRLFADPARLDGTGDILDWRVRRKAGEIVFSLSAGAILAHQPGLPPGICCAPAAPIRCGAPSAIRTRMTAKRALRRPLVPRRQLICRHFAFSSMG
jgi:hypothetical protein